MRAAVAALALGSRFALAQQPAPPPPSNGGLPFANPKNGRIVFSSNIEGQGELYVVNADGSGRVRVTHSADRKGAPMWSGDGTEIIYGSGTMDSTTLYAITPTGSGQPRRITSLPGSGLALSHDGKRVAYSRGKMPAATLVISALDGSNARELTDGKSPAFNAVWSNDDRQVAYAVLTMDSTRALAVWIANSDGSNARKVSTIPAGEGGAQWPAWSPDGKKIAVQVGRYGRDRSQNTAHIWVIDVASGNATKLAPHDRPYLDETPTWLPDGNRIAFQSDRTGRMEIWIMNADGSGARQVTK
jgi:TolB protein